MRTTHERYAYWTERANDVIRCTDCTPENHARTIRFLLAEAYEEGRADVRREVRAHRRTCAADADTRPEGEK